MNHVVKKIVTTTTVVTGMYFAAKIGLFGTESVIIDRDHQTAKMIPRTILPNQVEIKTYRPDKTYCPKQNKQLYPMPVVDGTITSIRPIEILYCRIVNPSVIKY